MPNQPLPRGQTAEIGTNTIARDLHIVGDATPGAIAIVGGAATAHVASAEDVDNYPIDNRSVSVTNTTPPPVATTGP